MSKEDDLAQRRMALQDLHAVMMQTVEVLEPFSEGYPEIDKHLSDARAICNDLKIKLAALDSEMNDRSVDPV